jgi:hypothetical protein
MNKISKDIPLAEITLRKYEKPYDLDKRELTKKLCLSIGLLQPGDSRDVIVDVMLTLINTNELLDSKQIEGNVIEIRKSYNLELKGIASSNIRRQIKRLRDLFFIENINNKYRISENDSLINIFEEKIEKFYIKSITERVKDYLKMLG